MSRREVSKVDFLLSAAYPPLELTAHQRKHLEKGLMGDTVEPLALPRGVYDGLQMATEKSLSDFLQANHTLFPCFAYLNTLPSGALLRLTHGRRASIRYTLGIKSPIAVAVFSRDRFQEALRKSLFSDDEKAMLRHFLKGRMAQNNISMYVKEKYEDRDCMAVNHPSYRLLFEGAQVTPGAEPPDTAVIQFGKEVKRRFEKIEQIHRKNLSEGRGIHAILEML